MSAHNFKDLTGVIFSRLTVLSRAKNGKGGYSKWHCVCECGNISVVSARNLNNGGTKSCGCLVEHGLMHHPLHDIWRHMKSRCYGVTDSSYKNYGARGIIVCEEWQDFKLFYNWAVKNGWKAGLTIERVDVNKNYNPENCTFICRRKQPRNMRTTKLSMEKARRIRVLYNNGNSQSFIAGKFDTVPSVVSRVVNDKIWQEDDLFYLN